LGNNGEFMPHNIGSMFYFGETPWHGQGKRLEGEANLEEAIVAGKLDWEVALIPIQTAESPSTGITRRKAVVRTDKKPGDPRRVLGVVHPNFHLLQNREGLQIFDALMGNGRSVYHTGGYLGNGEVVWLLAHIPDNRITVRGGDIVEPYLLFSNSHDGTRSVDIRLTTIRVVCQNTLNLALSKKNSPYVLKRSHNGAYTNLLGEAENYFRFLQSEIRNTENIFKALAAKEFPPQAFQGYLEKLLPLPAPPRSLPNPSPAVERAYEARRANIERMRHELASLYKYGHKNGLEIKPAEPSLWGALNAVTAYVDHAQAFKGDKYAHLMFGKGDQLKQFAYSLALEMNKD
jgi:phage/plasmid-like protein (TIGR03299 family)